MKHKKLIKFFLFVTIAVVALSSCSKDNQSVETGADNPISENPMDTPNPNEEDMPTDMSENPIGAIVPGALTLYSVQGGNVIKQQDFQVTGTALQFQQDTERHLMIWDLLKTLIPPTEIEKMNEFVIYLGAETGSFGYVQPTADDLSTWQMGLAIDFSFENSFQKKS